MSKPEYHVSADSHNRDEVFTDFDKAAGRALQLAVSGKTVEFDVVIWDEEAAREFGGDDAVERYNEDPDASVFDRVIVKATSQGRIA